MLLIGTSLDKVQIKVPFIDNEDTLLLLYSFLLSYERTKYSVRDMKWSPRTQTVKIRFEYKQFNYQTHIKNLEMFLKQTINKNLSLSYTYEKTVH